MMNMNIYRFAVQEKLRFPFKGQISVEELFDLSIEDLDKIYKSLKKKQKDASEESLLETVTREDKETAIKIEIVKDIFTEKKSLIEARKALAEKRLQNKKIQEIINRKENAALEEKSIEELKQMLEEEDI